MPPKAKYHGDLTENVYLIDPHRCLQHPDQNSLTVPLTAALLCNHFNKQNTFMVNKLDA